MTKSSKRKAYIIRLMVRQWTTPVGTFSYRDQDLYTQHWDVQPSGSIVFCGMVFEFDRYNTLGDWVFVAGAKHPKTIEVIKKTGRFTVGQLLWVRDVVPHGGHSDDSHQYVTMGGEHILASYAKEILP